MSNSLQPHGLYSPWNSPGQNTGVGILSLLQGMFPTALKIEGGMWCPKDERTGGKKKTKEGLGMQEERKK